MIIVVMGVSGSGKTTIGRKLAERLSIPFHDADDYHSVANKDKMANGNPLSDADRLPWLEELGNLLLEWNSDKGTVLACSALKESYRAILNSKLEDIKWVYLYGSKEVLKSRIEKRLGHFMKIEMLDSQIGALEPPDYGYHFPVTDTPDAIVESFVRTLQVN
ncbi:gluconokinase [Flagellimonas hymeniacidonis]|uniref:Gluconokinase n=1 Tax=Flagellimonas hymeniacidonis TaxID=2603628 RepID=A0A5C8V9G9_9FLAO|nr:gluconokinase [Flagellimonas hymeniacidonis]TXN38317.1 gluconokinase [Flagellimonas hymeniacidonis]